MPKEALMSVDATARLDALRAAHQLPIVVDEHRLSHVTLRGESRSTVRMCVTVRGVPYEVEGVSALGPVHALEEALRRALSQHYGEVRMSHVRSAGFDSQAREENRHIEVGMGVRAVVRIGFVTAVDAAGRLVDLSLANPIVAQRERRRVTGQLHRWSARAESHDTIDAAVRALVDGYSYFDVKYPAYTDSHTPGQVVA